MIFIYLSAIADVYLYFMSYKIQYPSTPNIISLIDRNYI